MTRALRPFITVVAVAATMLAVDTCARRPVTIPAPPYADSLAGVIARLFPRRADSADVRRVTWRQSRESFLGLRWIPSDPYRYRDASPTGDAPIIGLADLPTFTLTFARGQLTPFTAKHELAHLLLHEPHHPAQDFARLEAYRGR